MKGGSYSSEPMLSNVSWKHLFSSSTANLLMPVSKRGETDSEEPLSKLQLFVAGMCSLRVIQGTSSHSQWKKNNNKKRITVTKLHRSANCTWLLCSPSLQMGQDLFLQSKGHAFCLPSRWLELCSFTAADGLVYTYYSTFSAPTSSAKSSIDEWPQLGSHPVFSRAMTM